MGLLNSPPLLYAVAAVLVAWAFHTAFRTPVLRRHGVPLRKPPNTLPLLGNGILFLQARQKLFAWFVRCQHELGYETFQVAVPTLPPGVVISDPRNLEFVFKHEGSLVSKGSFVKGMLWDLFGHGIVNADGEVWRVQRKAGLGFLNTANLRVLTDMALPRYLAATLAQLRQHAASSSSSTATSSTTPVDLQAVFHELTSRLMGKLAYNMEMHADDAFTVAFDLASGATTERFQNPLWFVTEPLLGAADLRRALAVVKAFGRRIVASAVADRQAQHGGGADIVQETGARTGTHDAGTRKVDEISGSLIQSLLDAISDHDVVADAALNYLSAGRDTVAQGLTWTLYLLMQHPRVVDLIRAEVEHLLGPDALSAGEHADADADTDAAADDDRLRALARLTPAALPYTLSTFYEGLRLYPPIPFEIKQVDAALLTLPDGTELPRGTLVIWCSWALNRSRHTWGADAETFRPERWLDTSTTTTSTSSTTTTTTTSSTTTTPSTTIPPRVVSRSPAEFPVFHGGPRTCLGKKMAEAVAVQTIAAVVAGFDLALAAPGAERVTKTSLTLPMEGGLPCYVRPR
ncbi:cytochrome p450 monooxygenase [Niveomyces insectorum RCEF 264]|uniref:Cytochrome p450 monooxygenase n=1 Tax=Niveomyces insectorum RCEF 264 TaxID=1081102 RepID=A0A167ZZC2_9HYPO|nr:cytochrome p450 monooxygenase [Niveomyces insectorum RCEF 264]